MTSKPSIVVESLIKRYSTAEQNAVDNINFTVNEGEFFAFLGPNGAGKTTTISILTTTLAKTSGRVIIGGHDLERETKQVRQDVGIIFQNPSLDLDMTAEENIRLHVCLYGLFGYRPFYTLMSSEYRRRIEELAAIVDLGDNMFKKVKTFSGGMKRKLEIVRSLMHRPRIMFLDEPTTGLDPVSRRNVWQYLQRVQKDTGTSIFLTTHYLEEAEDADRVCIINHGKIIFNDTPLAMKHHLTTKALLLDAKNRGALRTELTKYGQHFTESDCFHVEIGAADTPQQLIAKLKTPLTLLRTHEPSLEEAYVGIITDDQTEGER